MTSTSSSSKSSMPRRRTSSSPRAGNSSADPENDWGTNYKPIPEKQPLALKFFAYAAGSTLPITIKKMTREVPKDRQGGSGWSFFGMETHLFWVARSKPRKGRGRRSRGQDRAEPPTARPPPLRPPQPIFDDPPEGVYMQSVPPPADGMMGGGPSSLAAAAAPLAGRVNVYPRPPGPAFGANFPGGIPIPRPPGN